jgi:leucyl-tRNA synthetase
MPISAAAEKLRREIELYGNPQVLPKEVQTELLKKGKQSQYEILTQMGIGSNIIEKFNKAEEWCYYFPPIGKEDLIKFGCFIDFDRSFITTSLNPYYDSFIRWQFNTLKERGYLKFGRRYSCK